MPIVVIVVIVIIIVVIVVVVTIIMDFEFLKTQELAPGIGREIEAFLDRQDTSHPYQFPDWTGGGPNDQRERLHCAIVRERGEIRWFAHCGAFSPVGKWLPVHCLTIHRGPVCDDAELTVYGLGKLAEKSKELGFASVTIAPEWVERPEWTVGNGLSREGWQPLPESRGSLRLDLRPASEELLRSFRHDTKLHIRRSEREGVVIRPAQSEEEIQEFVRIYLDMARKKNFPGEERGRLSHSVRWVVKQKDRGALLLAWLGTTPLGGVLVARAAKRSFGLFSATVKADRVTAGHLLQWSAIRWGKEHGCEEYDFGGHREGVNTGPASFKRGFCQAAVQFAPSYFYPLNRRICSMLDLVARVRSRAAGSEKAQAGKQTEAA
ncbi:MAG TPA: GNAT family N-acetyltransferase [Terriglobales bacterium]|nr:GNAT family N-acetyltransferase [Terriglobales bacterium]